MEGRPSTSGSASGGLYATVFVGDEGTSSGSEKNQQLMVRNGGPARTIRVRITDGRSAAPVVDTDYRLDSGMYVVFALLAPDEYTTTLHVGDEWRGPVVIRRPSVGCNELATTINVGPSGEIRVFGGGSVERGIATTFS